MRIKLASIAVLTAVFVSFISPLMAQVSPPEVAPPALPELTPDLLAKSQLGAQWMAAFALLMGGIAAVAGIDRYLKTKQWQRRELARNVVADFTRKRAIRNVSEILDFEEYRQFEIRLPDSDQPLRFEATDERLKRALRSHDQMVKTRQGLNILTQLSNQPGKMAENMTRVLHKYRDEEFVIELTLRDWFDEFLGALEACDNAIVANIVTAEDLEPFIVYWVRVIG
ncbi:MAG: hypothetical protein AAGH67_13935, partial [Cyanobacteria bacterium P01_H01_bin.162]